MKLLDRFLIATVVLSGVLLAHGPLRGAPDEAPACTNTCQLTLKYYDCTKQHAYEFFFDDCFHCVNGACQQREGMPGGLCVKTDLPRKFRYVKNYTKSCKCDDMTFRVEISGGTNLTEWDVIDTDVYYVCKPADQPDRDGDPTDPGDSGDSGDPGEPLDPLP